MSTPLGTPIEITPGAPWSLALIAQTPGKRFQSALVNTLTGLAVLLPAQHVGLYLSVPAHVDSTVVANALLYRYALLTYGHDFRAPRVAEAQWAIAPRSSADTELEAARTRYAGRFDFNGLVQPVGCEVLVDARRIVFFQCAHHVVACTLVRDLLSRTSPPSRRLLSLNAQRETADVQLMRPAGAGFLPLETSPREALRWLETQWIPWSMGAMFKLIVEQPVVLRAPALQVVASPLPQQGPPDLAWVHDVKTGQPVAPRVLVRDTLFPWRAEGELLPLPHGQVVVLGLWRSVFGLGGVPPSSGKSKALPAVVHAVHPDTLKRTRTEADAVSDDILGFKKRKLAGVPFATVAGSDGSDVAVHPSRVAFAKKAHANAKQKLLVQTSMEYYPFIHALRQGAALTGERVVRVYRPGMLLAWAAHTSEEEMAALWASLQAPVRTLLRAQARQEVKEEDTHAAAGMLMRVVKPQTT